MAFIRDVFAQSPEKRRMLNSTPAYAGGIFPVKPGDVSSKLTIAASVLSATAKAAAGTAEGVLGAAKDVVRALVQYKEIYVDSLIGKPIFFQYFPASITENRSSGIETFPLSGLSLPVPTFSGPMPRQISMRVTFSRESWNPDEPTLSSKWNKYNVDVGAAVRSLRALSYPSGLDTIPTTGVTPQPFQLVLPGVGLGVESDSLYCFLESYSVEYAAFFPDGKPRLAHVDLLMQEMLLNLAENATGRSFKNTIANYARGAADIFSTDEYQVVRGRTKSMDVSTNQLG